MPTEHAKSRATCPAFFIGVKLVKENGYCWLKIRNRLNSPVFNLHSDLRGRNFRFPLPSQGTAMNAETGNGGAIPGEWMDTEQAARYLRRSPDTLRRWRRQRTGPQYYRPGGTRTHPLYSRAELDAWVARIPGDVAGQ